MVSALCSESLLRLNKKTMNSSKIVQHFMDAYNRKDVDAFLSYMHPAFESSLFDEKKILCANLDN